MNDIRGPYLGPDGTIYWCKGPATQTYSLDGKPWTSAARHVLRRRPGERDVDNLLVGGMDNPVEIAFTDDGRTLSGVLLEDKPDEIVISAGVDKTYRLPRSAIEEMSRGEKSIMPEGLDKTLTERELADLVAYLKSL
ncbi:MAG TPA: hypothetical protein VMV10_25685 [Pirellulales bacterium]|nr:hypothetical protein [Pirellulales bacterium]